MERLWNRVKNGVKVGFNTAIKAAGIKKDYEDPEFVQRSQRLDVIFNDLSKLNGTIKGLSRTMIDESSASSALAERLEAPKHLEAGTAQGLRQSLFESCESPLERLLTRTAQAKQLRAKRWKNRELLQTSTGREFEKRSEKFARYHSAFTEAVDELDRLFVSSIRGILTSYQWVLQEFGKELGK